MCVVMDMALTDRTTVATVIEHEWPGDFLPSPPHVVRCVEGVMTLFLGQWTTEGAPSPFSTNAGSVPNTKKGRKITKALS